MRSRRDRSGGQPAGAHERRATADPVGLAVVVDRWRHVPSSLLPVGAHRQGMRGPVRVLSAYDGCERGPGRASCQGRGDQRSRSPRGAVARASGLRAVHAPAATPCARGGCAPAPGRDSRRQPALGAGRGTARGRRGPPPRRRQDRRAARLVRTARDRGDHRLGALEREPRAPRHAADRAVRRRLRQARSRSRSERLRPRPRCACA